jgi:hypothetical protein
MALLAYEDGTIMPVSRRHNRTYQSAKADLIEGFRVRWTEVAGLVFSFLSWTVVRGAVACRLCGLRAGELDPVIR